MASITLSSEATAFAHLPEIERTTLKLVRNRCIPLLFTAFIIAYLDRVNVGFAAITLNRELGLTATMFGWGAGLVSLGYAAFEVPSNMVMEKVGARRWMARIMITWGIVSCAMALVQGPLSFYLMRFLIGAAEAGFFPGAILYLTYWLPRRHRARYIGWFSLAIPLSSVIGSPISGLLLGLNGVLGLKGWQWLYIVEGLPAIILGVFIIFLFADRPRDAKWLTNEQRSWLEGELEKERTSTGRELRHKNAFMMLFDKRVLVLALVFFLTGVPSYGLSLWTPQIVKSFGLTNIETGLVSAVPFLFGCVGMIWWAKQSDRRKERAWHTGIAAFVGFVGLAAGAYISAPGLQLLAVCVSAAGIFGLKGPWLAMISEAFTDKTAASGIAWVSSLGSLSGFAAPYMVGLIIDHFHSYRLGLLALGVNSLLGAILVVVWGITKWSVVKTTPISDISEDVV